MPPCLHRRDWMLALLATPAMLWVAPARAQGGFVPEEGSDYVAIARPQPTDSPGKIEVVDFFWYGCPHCYHFLPSLEAWRKRQPADVAFKRVPVDFNDPGREPHSRIYYTLQAVGRADDMHVKVFDAFHLNHKRLIDADEIADFMAANGIDRNKWLATYNSFTIANLTARARTIFQAYGIEGTPTVGIDGRFLTAPTMVRAQSDPNRATIATLDFVVERVRRERRSRPS